MNGRQLPQYLILSVLIGIPLIFPVVLLLIGHGGTYTNESFYSTLKTLGSMAMVLMALFLVSRSKHEQGQDPRYLLLASGLIGMGVLDGFQTVTDSGNTLVFLHTMASLVGGLCFVLVWLPLPPNSVILRFWSYRTALVLSVVIGLISVSLEGRLPTLLEGGEFTTLAIVLNNLAGFLFLGAACRFILDYWDNEKEHDFLFACLALMFGSAELTFKYSGLWDLEWWILHIIRLGGSFLALVYLSREYLQMVKDVKRSLVVRQQAEEELRKLTEELMRSNRELEQFAYVASHDLQEPLRMVVSYLQLLERRYQDELDDQAHEYIEFAVEGGTRMGTLINDLLALSRIGPVGSIEEGVSIESILKEVLSNLDSEITKTRADITHDPLPKISADRDLLVQLFQCLIGNAIRFRSKEPPSIHISVVEGDRGWQFSLQDNGIGIEPEYHEQIFVMFKRLHGRSRYHGNGIGLAICKKIIESHKGQIWVESAPGEGSVFFFTIPVPEPVDESEPGRLGKE